MMFLLASNNLKPFKKMSSFQHILAIYMHIYKILNAISPAKSDLLKIIHLRRNNCICLITKQIMIKTHILFTEYFH